MLRETEMGTATVMEDWGETMWEGEVLVRDVDANASREKHATQLPMRVRNLVFEMQKMQQNGERLNLKIV
jgi:hypothetical protein